MEKFNVAIVGAPGMVGRTFIKILEERNFPVNNLYLFASTKSIGTKIKFNNKYYEVEVLDEGSFDKEIHIALFSAGASISKHYAKIASSKGIVVIDNSSAWRMDDDVPLVVPEANPQDVLKHKGIIANPNCSTIQAIVALKPLDDKYKIKRIVYSSYQAVSGAGVKGLYDLNNNTSTAFPIQINDNVIPQIGSLYENGYSEEEIKMINETKKILHNQNLNITATCVRVPVKYGHSESINVEFENNFVLNELIDLLKNSDGLTVSENYATPLQCAAKNEVFVGRIRKDYSLEKAINMWVVADNVRKGAATNAIQIAELLIKTL